MSLSQIERVQGLREVLPCRLMVHARRELGKGKGNGKGKGKEGERERERERERGRQKSRLVEIDPPSRFTLSVVSPHNNAPPPTPPARAPRKNIDAIKEAILIILFNAK